MPPRKIAPAKPKKPVKFPDMEFTPGQKECLDLVDRSVAAQERLFVLWFGGVRASKTTGACFGMMRHSLGRSGAQYALGAHTIAQAIDIFVPKFEMVADKMDIPIKVSRAVSKPYIEFGQNYFGMYGGDREGRDKRVQGLTWAGLLLDELTLLNKAFVFQCEARVSENAAIRIYTSNKLSPYHWTTRYYWDRAKKGQIAAHTIDSQTADNPHIGEDYIAERIREYDDMERSRFIDNEFTLERKPLAPPVIIDDKDVTGRAAAFSVISGAGADIAVTRLAAMPGGGYCVVGAELTGATTDLTPMDLGPVVYVDSGHPALAKKLRKTGKAVKGYTVEHHGRRLELLQNVLADDRLAIAPSADLAIETLDTYAMPGAYPTAIAPALELAAEYISRRTS